jgi:hypothetical protein
MAWATPYITRLKLGETVSFRPRGNSMQGKIESGQLCTVEPINDYNTLEKGDIVLCKVNGSEYLHLIKVNAFKSATIAAELTAGLRRIRYSGNVLKLKISL